MDNRISQWLSENGLGPNSLNSYMSRLRSLETAYGDLDDAYDRDGFAAMLSDLVYSSEDERSGRPNPCRVPINSHLYKQLASLRTALRRYGDFRDGGADLARPEDTLPENDGVFTAPVEQTFSMERDLERALRAHPDQLESGLTLIDGGTQRQVASGRIDILARDAAGTLVVIELKSVRAPRDAVAQVLAYMGDMMDEVAGSNPGAPVRGILVAPEFDPRAVAAARVVPGLTLFTYAFSFSFQHLTA